MSFQIISDVTCDLSAPLRKEFNIGYIPGHISLPGGMEMASMLDWNAYGEYSDGSADVFYANLMKNPDAFKTAPCNVKEIFEFFSEYAEKGEEVLMTCISSGMSGTYSFACEARRMVLETHPNAKIRIVDTRRYSVCNGLMCIYASIMRAKGKSLNETADYLEENRLRFHQMGWHDNLSFVAKKGRINHSTAFMGRLIGIKTLGECSPSGMTTVIGKVKGTKKAYHAVLEYIADTIQNPEEQIIVIGHSSRIVQAEELKKRIEARFHPKKVYIGDIFPACGANIGPGLIAAYYVGTPISDELEAEKKLMADIIARS